jgi:hypothetical protein
MYGQQNIGNDKGTSLRSTALFPCICVLHSPSNHIYQELFYPLLDPDGEVELHTRLKIKRKLFSLFVSSA